MLIATPNRYVEGRLDAHRLAYSVIAEARRASTGRFGLQWTKGGFGTPVFDATQVRAEGTELVGHVSESQRGKSVSSRPAT
jgi:hypothetical protein